MGDFYGWLGLSAYVDQLNEICMLFQGTLVGQQRFMTYIHMFFRFVTFHSILITDCAFSV